MSPSKSTYHSRLYRDFMSIDPKSYREQIRFYEKHESKIRHLSEVEHFDLLVTYVDALFEIGAYRKHLLLIDHVIEGAITHNVEEYKGQDLFRSALFKKAASLHNTHQFKKADIILRQLVRMNPHDNIPIRFLKKCIRRCRPGLLNAFRATSVFLFFLAALVIAMEVLFVRPFYHMHTGLIENSRNSLFLLGCLVLVGGFLYNRWLAEKEVEGLVRKIRRRKQKEEEQGEPLHV